MRKLMTTNSDREWVQDGLFETVKQAASRIRQLEDYPAAGIFFQVLVETEFGTDEEALSHLEHTGRRALYVVKRQLQ
jgi:hypothetical protein